jgi:hypothetical protein
LGSVLDREDLAIRDSGGVELRRLCGGAGGSCRVNRGLGEALRRTAPWPGSEAGMLRAFRRGDVADASAVGEQTVMADAVMADAVKAGGQDVNEEAADELLRGEEARVWSSGDSASLQRRLHLPQLI